MILRALSIILPESVQKLMFRNLSAFLDEANPNADLTERLLWLEDLLAWMQSRAILSERDKKPHRTSQDRFRYFLRLLDENDERKLKVARLLQSVLRDVSLVHLFSSTGLAKGNHLIGEVVSRLQKQFFPSLSDEKDGSEVLPRLFTDEDEVPFMASLDSADFERLLRLFAHEVDPRLLQLRLRQAMLDAILILAAEVRAIGLSEEVRSRSAELTPKVSPAYQLGQACDLLAVSTDAADACRREITKCRGMVKLAFEHIEEFGVNVGLVYRLERMSGALSRIEDLLHFLAPTAASGPATSRTTLADFVSFLAREAIDNRSVGALIQGNLHLLARKIVERTGATGEHYITRDFGEYLHMLKGAAGGGLLTVATVALKYVAKAFHLPVFFDFLAASFNYSGSFLLMQALGFKLATKQPSMTAAALAAKLEVTTDLKLHYLGHEARQKEVSAFTDEVVQTVRSQFAAALGNVGAVIPGAMLFDFVYRYSTGKSFLTPDTAQSLIQSLHPLMSMTIPYAALTGVLLWLASIAAGWLENWAVFNRVPEAIARSRRFIRAFDKPTAEKMAQKFSHAIGGIGGNVSLGVMLAAVPALGKLLGLSLDVRHITLSTGALTLAVCTLGWGGGQQFGLGAAFVGIVCIGLLNFGVSFVLAIRVALQARDVDMQRASRLLRSVGAAFLRKPWLFFIPAR